MSEKRARVEDFKEAVVGQPLDTKLNTGLVRRLIEKLDVLSTAEDSTSGAGLLYVFKHHDDPWLRAVQQICTGTLGWEDYEWRAAMDSNGNPCPTMFAQLLTVYRFRGLSPVGAIEELMRHPDYRHLRPTWEENRDG